MPEIEDRSEQPYVGIAVTARMDDLSEVVPALNGEVFGWLTDHDIAPVGAPLWRYTVTVLHHGHSDGLREPPTICSPGLTSKA